MNMERSHYLLDMDWRFHRGDVTVDAKKGHKAVYVSVKAGCIGGPASRTAYDDSTWEHVNLPHDYMRESAFSPDADHAHGYREFCNGWYRKCFSMDPSQKGKHALLVFDGISTSSMIYLNGSLVARSFNGYSEIVIDVTDRLYFEKINTLAVYTRGDDINGWWYEGAGIYRHAHLYIKESLHVAHNGIWAKPVRQDRETNRWCVELEVTLENSAYSPAMAAVRATLLDGETPVTSAISGKKRCAADGQTVVTLSIPVNSPKLWDIDSPNLYRLEVELLRGSRVVDRDSTRIGFRTYWIDPNDGFFLNDRPLKIKGTCNHQDHAGVGVALTDSMQYYRIRCLKEMGTNAYRCAHNPPAREILDACDEYGMIVMDENRNFELERSNLQNLETLIRRDRNHPSVIFYSLFNEEPLQTSPEGAAIFCRLKSLVRRLDDTRIILGAVNAALQPNGVGVEMDAFGQNYGLHNKSRIVKAHAEFPHIPLIGAENNSAVTTRGCYQSDREGAQILNNYDEEVVPWGSTVRDQWRLVRDCSYFAGIFIWTGFDYRGEPTPFQWPSCSSQFGVMDACGFPKDAYYFHKATFTDEPMMHLLPHWNWNAGELVRVMTVSNCEEVELFLNGRSLGRRSNDVCEQNEWSVPFEAGVLLAIGYRDGQAVASDEQRTVGKARSICLHPDRTSIGDDGQDTVPVRVSVVDANGVELPTASNLIHFEIEGDGVVAGVGNGDPNSHEPDHLPYRKLYCGLCQVMVKADPGAGSLKLKAHADGLESAELSFKVCRTEHPQYIFFRENSAVSGILVSPEDSNVKPDPRREYGDDDMNSFAPVTIENRWDSPQPSGFHSGWREYRIPITVSPRLSEGQMPALEFPSLICDTAEFYQNGELIFSAKDLNRNTLTVPLHAAEKSFEVRMLLKARKDIASGVCVSVSHAVIDKN